MKVQICFLLLCIAVVWGLDSRWKLMWQDEFNGNQLDSNKWAARKALYSNGNYFRPDYATVSNGNLIIKSDRKVGSPNEFETGYVDSAGLAYFTYGRFEISAKLPSGQGVWPAHWMLSETKCWPYGIEFDILELPYGLSYEPTSAHATIHYGENCGLQYDKSNGSKIAVASNFFDGYHTFALEWFPGNLTFFVDNVAYHKVNFNNVGGRAFPEDPSPHFFILDTYIGGWSPAPDASVPFPKYHYIDYVRAYGWQPCVQGCGDHGVCNQATGTCQCDSDYAGTFCEFSFAKSYGTSFAYKTALDSVSAGTATINNGLALTINATGCPGACKYNQGQWSKNEGFGSGKFSFNLIAPNISGYFLFVDGNGGDLSAQGFKLTFNGGDTTRFSFQTSSSNASAMIWQWVYPGFNPSLAYHVYTVEFTRGQSYSLYIDYVKKFTAVDPIAVTSVHLYPRITYRNDSTVGAYKPSTLVVKSFTFSPTPGVQVPRPVTGTGLTGSYYGKMDFTQLKGTQVDPLINFNWGALAPSTPVGMPADLFSVRWTGKIVPLYSQIHTFYVSSDDGCNLWVNGIKIISNWVPQALKVVNGSTPLLAGNKYDIILEYMEQGGGAQVSLSWSAPSLSKSIVPTSQLYSA